MSLAYCRSLRPALAALVSLFGAVAAADDQPLFDYQEFTLDNGLRVVSLEDFSCPVVAVQVWYHVGSKDEDPERNGFAHMFEHMMFRGTENLGPEDHFNFIRRTGGECNAFTSFDQTVYVQTLPANQLELALWLEAERMAFLKIDQESFDTERKVVEEERRLGLNRPYGTVPEELLAQIFKHHPYRWMPIGNIAHLRAASVAELRAFWTKYYVPSNATLVVVGAVKHADVQRLAKEYFGWIPRYPEPDRVHVEEPQQTKARTITIEARNAPAPVVGAAYRTVPERHPDNIPLQMLATILGGGESSRLYRNLVADNELAVAAMAGAFSLEQDGLLAAGAVLSPMGGSPRDAIVAINDEIKRIRGESVTPEEIEKARNQLLKAAVTSTMTVASKAQTLGSAAVVSGDVAEVNRRLDEIRAVTAEDIQRVANEYLAPDRAIRVKIERNLMGTLLGGKSSEEDAPLTARPETEAPPPGRAGAERPADFPSQPPVSEKLATDVKLEWSERALSNGMRLIVVPNHEVPYVSMMLGLKAGAWTEDKPGAAAMAMSMLTKGTEKHDEGQLAEDLERYAISLSAEAGIDTASVTAACLHEQTPRALELLAEVVRTPTFPEDEFEKLRKQTLTGLAISTAEPAYIADRQLRRVMFGEHPYGRTATGEVADGEALNVADCSAWWSRYVRPEMATLIVSGDITAERAFELAEGALGDWKVSTPMPAIALPDIPEPQATHIYLVDQPGVQSQIRVGQLGMTRSSPDYFDALVVSGYFGGAFSSRLNETIRVKKGLTYGARGGFAARRFAGQFTVNTFSKTATTTEAVSAIFDELKRLRAEPPSADELNDTRSYIVGSFPADRETPQQVASDLWQIVAYGLPSDYFEQMLSAVEKTSAAECAQVAQQHVNPDQMIVVVVGTAAELKDELEKIAPVTVVEPTAESPEGAGEE